MRLILKYIVTAVFCALFLTAAVFAQDTAGGKPADGDKKAEKKDKADKTDKITDGAAPITLEDLAVNFPEVDGWIKGDIQKYPTEELGFSINYESREGGRVTVYVYNGGNKTISGDLNSKLIKNELSNAKGEIKRVAEMGAYQDVKELKNDTVTLGGTGGKVKTLRTVYKLSIKGREMTSEIYIFAHDNRFIKIRATRPFEKDETINTALANLFAEIDAMFSK